MHSQFGLVLMVNHACNLRCSYCYTGLKFSRAMPLNVATKSVERAVASLSSGGVLELSFFGGEPLLEAELIGDVIAFARVHCERSGLTLSTSMTTNGTIESPAAWKLISDPTLDLTVSFDGLPQIHDRHRSDADGRGSSSKVLATMRRLISSGKSFQVIAVVRPDTVERLPDGLRFLRELGVDQVVPSLDLWTTWNSPDIQKLEVALQASAEVWREGLPCFGVSWFNEKAVQLSGVPMSAGARCGFGHGEIAVAPSGNLYPCERVIGEDRDGNPLRLNGHALQGNDFLNAAPVCSAAREDCGLSCACSNFVRTGRIDRGDDLLRELDRICLRETRRVLLAPVA